MEYSRGIILGGRYQILDRLGYGGMANVFRARDLNLQRDVAIKILRDDLIDDPGFQNRFLQEARAAANLAHPSIVTIYDFGHDAGRYYIIMEYVEGTDLKTYLRREGHLSIKESIDLMRQMCAGVGYAHRAGLVHCDLKPQNILVASDGRAKITDFGISRALASINPEEHSDVVWGSPKYFAPEQAAGNAPSPSSDVYALGVIFFEMLTGRLPFEADTSSGYAELHQTADPPSPRLLNPEIPVVLDSIILKVLSKEPSSRYRTADQFGRVLTTFSTQESLEVELEVPVIDPTPYYHHQEPVRVETVQPIQVDWIAVFLGLLAFIAVGGLIPLWLWVCLLYPSCPF
ncbi:MAG: protein kinase [Anaerolineales bacterium]|nr:protein kinase [Anaerolineales bacterium]